MNARTLTATKIVQQMRMLSSPVDGEALAACHAIGQVLDTVDLSFQNLVEVIGGWTEPQLITLNRDREPRRQAEFEPSSEWRDLARRCLGNFGDLRPVERRFPLDIMRWCGKPTPKQMTWLLAIAETLGVGRRSL